MISNRISLFTAAALLLTILSMGAQTPASPSPKNSMTTHHAKGTFEVTLKPVPLAEAGADAKLARMSIDKKFAGDLVATSTGEMLSAGTATEGSAGYVAIERVVGELDGRKGAFVFQHSGSMDRGRPQLSVTVVPDSGTETLAGIKGTLQIEIRDGKHFYDFAYTLPQ